MGTVLRLVAAALVLLSAQAAAQLHMAPAWAVAAYPLLGLVSFSIYGLDKRAARRGDRRVPEATLHGIDLMGGIAGGLIGQVLFRHKTHKEKFVFVTTLISTAHAVVLVLLALGTWRFPKFLFFG